MSTTIRSGRAWTSRLSIAAVATAAVTATVAGCGSATNTSTAPDAALAAAVASLSGSQHLGLKLSLTGALDKLPVTSASDQRTKDAVESGYIGLSLDTNGGSKLTGLDLVVHTHNANLAEIRYVGTSLFAQLNPGVYTSVSGKPFPTSEFNDAASTFKLPIISALGQGKWVGLTNLSGAVKAATAEIKSLASSAPGGASPLPTSSADVAQIRGDLIDALTSSTTVTDMAGSTPTSANRKLSVVLSPKQLLTTLQSSLSSISALAPALAKLPSIADSIGDKTYKIEVDTSGGKVTRLDFPINQVLSPDALAKLDGKSVDIVMDVDNSGGAISAPNGAVITDGTKLVDTYKQILAQEKAAEAQFGSDSSGDDGGSIFGDDGSGSDDSGLGSSPAPSAAP